MISLKAGGTCLNVTAADYVIHMNPWWNPAVEDQASDRAHRIGPQRPVTKQFIAWLQRILLKIRKKTPGANPNSCNSTQISF